MFSDRLKELRLEKGLTQERFAQELNVSKGAIAMWETGKRTPDIEMLKTISNYFSVSVDELIGNDISSTKKEISSLDDVYLSFAKNAKDNGIDPKDIELALETIKAMRNKK